jgi:hypothetical protein
MKSPLIHPWLVAGLVILAAALPPACNGGGGEQDTTTDNPEGDALDVHPDEETEDTPAQEVMEFDWLDGQCSGSWVDLTRSPANMVYLVDRSTRMLDPSDGHDPDPAEMGSCNTLNYAPATGITYRSWWDEVADALGTHAGTYQDRIGQGLVLYPGPGRIGEPGAIDGVRMCDGPVTRPVNEVDPDLGSAAAIVSVLDDPDSIPVCEGGLAPMRKGIEISSSALEGAGAGPRRIVVIARGGPNCNLSLPTCTEADCTVSINYCDGTTGTVGCQDSLATIEEIRTLHDEGGVDTTIVGLPGSETYAAYFDSMAEAGGTALPGTPKYRAVTAVAELAPLLSDIAGGEIVCIFALPSAPSDTTSINVLADDRPLVRDDPDGYVYHADDHTVELTGQSCQDLLDGTITEVKFLSGCPPYVG